MIKRRIILATVVCLLTISSVTLYGFSKVNSEISSEIKKEEESNNSNNEKDKKNPFKNLSDEDKKVVYTKDGVCIKEAYKRSGMLPDNIKELRKSDVLEYKNNGKKIVFSEFSETFGPPDMEVGSGTTIYIYELPEQGKLVITNYFAKLIDKDGNEEIITKGNGLIYGEGNGNTNMELLKEKGLNQ